jgi:Homing endonuclease associated repeat/HNH endonuclease
MFEIRLRRRNVPEVELAADMQRCAASLGSPTLSAKQYDQHGTFHSTTIINKFGTWNLALEKAGLPISLRMNISDEELFENLADVWIKRGRQPSRNDIDGKHFDSLFSKNTYSRRFGSWNGTLLAFSEFINSKSDNFNDGVEPNVEGQPTERKRRRTPREINWRLRAKILIKHSCICQMCGNSPAKNSDTVLHVDHILAWANGGETIEENLQTLCAVCNIGKSDQLLPDQNSVP